MACVRSLSLTLTLDFNEDEALDFDDSRRSFNKDNTSKKNGAIKEGYDRYIRIHRGAQVQCWLARVRAVRGSQ